MNDYTCPKCYLNTYYSSSAKLLISEICNHKLCENCIQSLFATSNKVQCPQCRLPLTISRYIEITQESQTNTTLVQVAKRVFSILNDTRASFPNTPDYNKFLETRESIIHNILYGNDIERKQSENQLRQIERINQKKILENNALQQRLNNERVRNVVQKEGNFYEIVKFPQNVDSKSLFHGLRTLHLNLFTKEEIIKEATGKPRPLDANISMDIDLPRRQFDGPIKIELSMYAGGYNSYKIKEREMTELVQGIRIYYKNSLLSIGSHE